MREITLDEVDQVTGGNPVVVALIGGAALIIAALIKSCSDGDGGGDGVTATAGNGATASCPKGSTATANETTASCR